MNDVDGSLELEQVCERESAASIPAVPGVEAGPPPDYLNADPNPLLLPTQPDAVEIIGTQPITLDQALELAYRNSPTLQIAQRELERSRFALRQTQAGWYPNVDLVANLQWLSNPIQGSGLNDEDVDDLLEELNLDEVPRIVTFNGDLSVVYDLYTGGRRANQIQAASQQVRQQELALEQQREALRLETANDYYTVQESLEGIRISQAFLAEACRNLRDTQLFFDAEVGTRFDVLRAEVQVGNAQQAYVLALSQWRRAQRQLAEQLNLPPSLNVATTEAELAGTWPLSLEESIILAFQNRAEMESQLVARQIALAQREIALSAQRPQVNLAARGNLLSIVAGVEGTDTNLSDTGWNLAANGRWQVYDGGAAQARASQASQEIEVAEQRYSQTRNTVRLEVEEAYASLSANLSNIETARLSVAQAQEALRLARRRFDAGVGDQLDVLVAQRELAEVEGNLVRAILGYNRALAALQRAVSNLSP